ncbi:MAG TPA: HipA family kinase [Bryobacteraceae bacterium]|nr:HipA family kinase [Bryobacteraceae bacterium]
MPLTAVRHVRKMRGGAQAHLLEADDGNWYVVKFRNNPQHHRVLVNELLSATFLEYLKIATPESAVIEVTPQFLAANPEIHISIGTRRTDVEPGWHFGSRYPGDPGRLALYDFLPDSLLEKVLNLDDFRAILVFDKWAANADGRQSVFYRALVRQGAALAGNEHVLRPGFIARMIDHGYTFNGPHWDFPESAVQGLYARPIVYQSVRSLDDFQPWLEQVMNFPEEVIDRAWKRIPAAWIADEEDELERMLTQLVERRQRLPELISACRQARTNSFPSWI